MQESAQWSSRFKIEISLLSWGKIFRFLCWPYAGSTMEWLGFCFKFIPWDFYVKIDKYIFYNLFQVTSWFGSLCSLGLLCKLFSPANNREQRDQSLERVSWSYSNHKAEGWRSSCKLLMVGGGWGRPRPTLAYFMIHNLTSKETREEVSSPTCWRCDVVCSVHL